MTLGHKVVELLSLLRHHHPRVLLHAERQTWKGERVQESSQTRRDTNFSKIVSVVLQCLQNTLLDTDPSPDWLVVYSLTPIQHIFTAIDSKQMLKNKWVSLMKIPSSSKHGEAAPYFSSAPSPSWWPPATPASPPGSWPCRRTTCFWPCCGSSSRCLRCSRCCGSQLQRRHEVDFTAVIKFFYLQSGGMRQIQFVWPIWRTHLT